MNDSRLDETLPLVRIFDPLVTLQRWRRFARWLGRNGGGVLAAIAGDDRPHGIAAYRTVESLAHGRALHVEPMITFEIKRAAPARAALLEALDLLAMSKGCDTLVVAAGSRGYADPNCAKGAVWAALGFEMASVTLARRVQAKGPAALRNRRDSGISNMRRPDQGNSRSCTG